MKGRVLVGYATKMGSTQEIAEAVAAELRGGGAAVEVRPLREVRSLEGFAAVVIGAPMYMFHLHKDAKAFLARHRTALAAVPTAVFSLGPFHDVEKEWTEVRAVFEKELGQYPWLSPVAREVFGGAFDPAKLGFPYSLIPAMKKLPPSDIRDWEAIRRWADGLREKL
jgi:menaquinone-dependent protoporphyrinogen oxidase